MKRKTCFILVIICLLYTKCYAVEDTKWKIYDDSECQYDYMPDWHKAVFTADSGKVYVRFRDAVNLMLYSCDEHNNLTDIRSMNDDFFVEKEYDYAGTKIPYSVGLIKHRWGATRKVYANFVQWAPISAETELCIGSRYSPVTMKYPLVGEELDYRILGDSPYDIISQLVKKEPIPEFANDPKITQTERSKRRDRFFWKLQPYGMYYFSFYDIKTNCIYLVYDVPFHVEHSHGNTYYSCMFGVSMADGTVTQYSVSRLSPLGSREVGPDYPYSDGNGVYNNGYKLKETVLTCKLNDKAYAFNDAIAVYYDYTWNFDAIYVPFDRLCEILGYSYSEDRSNKVIHIKYMHPENDLQGLVDRKYKPFEEAFQSTVLWNLLKQEYPDISLSDLFDVIMRNRRYGRYYSTYGFEEYLSSLNNQ